MNAKQALLIVDAQVNMFDESFSIFKANEIINTLRSLILRAREKSIPVIYVRNNGGEGEPDQPGTPGWEIHPSFAPNEKEIVIDKQGADAFHETELEKELGKQGIKQLVFAGMQTEMCITTSVRRAIEMGYEVILVSDGHSTFDFDDMSAIDAINTLNNEIGSIAKVENAHSIEFG